MERLTPCLCVLLACPTVAEITKAFTGPGKAVPHLQILSCPWSSSQASLNLASSSLQDTAGLPLRNSSHSLALRTVHRHEVQECSLAPRVQEALGPRAPWKEYLSLPTAVIWQGGQAPGRRRLQQGNEHTDSITAHSKKRGNQKYILCRSLGTQEVR